MQILKLVFLSIVLTFSVVIEAQVKCATIAEIKKQSAGTQIEYTGAAQTTFYNSTYSGLFMEDETGGILLKGYNQSSKNNDKVKDNMSVTGLIGTWELGDSGKPSGLKIDSKNKNLPTVSENNFVPTSVEMVDFISNPTAYEGRAIVIKNAITTKKDGKNYLGEVPFYTSNVSAIAPAAGEFAGCYVGLEYNRFLLCSAEQTKATEFFAFSDMAAYYKGKQIEILDAKVQGSVLVNYVQKINDNQTALFTQYVSTNGMINGLIVFVEGNSNIKAGDEIGGICGKYTDVYKNVSKEFDFKGAYFYQSSSSALNVISENNKLVEKANVNISSLISHKSAALDFHSQIIVSRSAGKLYLSDGKYYYKVSYEQSTSGDDTTGFEQVEDSICVVALNGLDLSKYVGDGVLLRAIYDAGVINQQPTLIVRNENDFLKTYYSFNNIGEMLAAGQLSSSSIVYELKGEAVVNMKLSQQKGALNWAFIEDETGVLGINCSDQKFSASRKDKIKGIKGRFEMSGKNLPNITLSSDAKIEVLSSKNELNIIRASLKEVIKDTMKYAGHIVEIYNVKGDSVQYEDHDGTKYWSYFIEEDGYKMNYTFPKNAEEAKNRVDYQTGTAIVGLNTIEAFVNYNCLDGGYVIYEISRTPQESVIVDTEYIRECDVNIYSSNGVLYVEAERGQKISVYTINGLCVYSGISVSDCLKINNLRGIVIVNIDGIPFKAYVK